MPDLSFLPDFLQVTPRLLTAGQPAPAEFGRLRNVGVDVIINLAAPGATDYNADEAALALENGLAYVHIPVVWTAPQRGDFETFAAVLGAQGEKVVLVHCAKNMRVAAFIYAYRVKFEGEAESIARARMEQIWNPDEVWSAFLADILSETS